MAEPELSEAGALLLGVEPEVETPTDDHPAEEPTLDESSQSPETETPEEPTEPKELDLAQLLEKGEIDNKAFYKLNVPGTEKTWGEAKDALQGSDDLALRTAQQESSFQDRENGLLTKAKEAQELYAMIPEQFQTPEVSAQMEQFKTRDIQKENQLTLMAIPEWRDPLKATSDREAIGELMRGYGYTDGEIGQVYNSRELKMLKDFQSLKALVAGIPDKAVKPKIKAVKQGKRPATGVSKIEGATEAGAILLRALAKG